MQNLKAAATNCASFSRSSTKEDLLRSLGQILFEKPLKYILEFSKYCCLLYMQN